MDSPAAPAAAADAAREVARVAAILESAERSHRRLAAAARNLRDGLALSGPNAAEGAQDAWRFAVCGELGWVAGPILLRRAGVTEAAWEAVAARAQGRRAAAAEWGHPVE